MDDLFDQLKAEPPVKKSESKENLSELEPVSKKVCTDDTPSASPTFKLNKSRNNSSEDKEIFGENLSGALNLEDSNIEASAETKRSPSKDSDSKEAEDATNDSTNETPKKQMPTKAQKKLFEMPTENKLEIADIDEEAVVKEATALVSSEEAKDTKVKRCRVRIKRENLVRLREKFAREQAARKTKKKKNASPTKPLQQAGNKRKADAGGSPPAKKGKSSPKSKAGGSPPKSNKGKNESKSIGSPPGKKGGFFIKLGNNLKKSTSSPLKKSSHQQQQTNKEKNLRKSNSRVQNSTHVFTTKATKFTRSQLIRTFGKRYFNSRVRIERCKHPLMLTFESNARARKLQAKNKSKNLSVSFKEQVEIIGLSDTESYESDEVNNVTAPKGSETLLAGATPLHLKKVENGKVIDDIEFDPKLFGDPVANKNSSTPLRKKMEKKSYSPLKDDSSSSARSELLKSANEKLPPCALRRLSGDDEDDEDDECEWIVPIDIPERRTSHTNSESEKDTKSSSNSKELVVEATETENTPADTLLKEGENTTNEKVLSKENSPAKEPEVITETDDTSLLPQVNGDEVPEKGNTPGEGKEEGDKSKENSNAAEKTLNKVAKNDCPSSLLENESSSGTPNPPFTPENNGTPDLLVKTAIEKLSEDIEKSESDLIEMTSLNNATAVESA